MSKPSSRQKFQHFSRLLAMRRNNKLVTNNTDIIERIKVNIELRNYLTRAQSHSVTKVAAFCQVYVIAMRATTQLLNIFIY